jgi:transcriptional regulator with AAA-type ATPase domain
VQNTFRSSLLPILGVAYVCLAAIWAESGSVLPYLALFGLPFLLWETWRRTRGSEDARDRVSRAARTGVRAGVWGAALWVAARTGPTGRSGFDAAANLGAGTCLVAALGALSRLESLGGMLVPHPATRSLDAAAFSGLLWAIAVAVPGTRALMPARMVRLDPLAIDYATTAAAAGGLLVLVGACWRLRVLRKLELGVGDRVRGALALAITALAVVMPAAALDVGPPDRLLPAGVVTASLLCLWAATTPEATTVSSALRGALAVVTLGAPTVLLAGMFARQMPEHAGVIVLSATTLAVVVGLIARAVARPLGPEQSRWLEAIDLASRGALQPEPDAALRAALAALGKAFDTTSARPELWRAFPAETLSVDIAGYLHADQAEAPERLYELALAEPERTLRAEVLQAVQVRRPEVRSLLEWFAARRAFSATLVLDEEGCQGFLLLPHGGRNSPMTLEEARSIRILSDRISSLLAVSSALARSRERELEAEQRLQALQQERERLESIIACTASRHQAHAERYARSARKTAYSPAARLALGELERQAQKSRGIVLLAPIGTEAPAWMALAHLSSPRRDGPWVLVDAAQGAEHELERWQDPSGSPLKQADGGTLAVLDLPGLPLEVQRLMANALAHAEAPTRTASVPPLGLIAAVREPVEALVQRGKLERRLARALDSPAIRLPAVAERAEDLRAMVLDHLSELGIRLRGDPLGIDAEGLRLIMEHTWPGNELELASTLLLAARLAKGKLVTAEELGRVGLELPKAPLTTEASPLGVRSSPRSPRRR